MLKGGPKRISLFSALLKRFFLLTKSFGCQRKSLRYWIKENFDTSHRSSKAHRPNEIVQAGSLHLWTQVYTPRKIKKELESKDEPFLRNCNFNFSHRISSWSIGKIQCVFNHNWCLIKFRFLSLYVEFRPHSNGKIFLMTFYTDLYFDF